MKISKKCIKLDLSKDFVVNGSKSDLLKFETILKYNGVKDLNTWNNSMRISDHCNYLFFCSKKMYYQYHSHTCSCKPIDVKEFL